MLADIDAIKPVLAGDPGPGVARRGHVPAQPGCSADRIAPRAHRLLRPAPAQGVHADGAAGDSARHQVVSDRCGRWTASTSVVEAGTFHGLIGPNGSGKSTLLKAIAGAHFADHRHDPLRRAWTSRATPPYERARAGLSLKFQITAVLPELSVYDNVLLALQSRETSWPAAAGRASGAARSTTR